MKLLPLLCLATLAVWSGAIAEVNNAAVAAAAVPATTEAPTASTDSQRHRPPQGGQPETDPGAASANLDDLDDTGNSTVQMPYSDKVRFYSADGRLVFTYATAAADAFVCVYAGSRRRKSNLTYELTVLHSAGGGGGGTVDIQGRLARLSGDDSTTRRHVIGCSVTYTRTGSGQIVTEWNVMVVDSQAKPSAWSSSSPAAAASGPWLIQDSVSLASAKAAPLKSETNTVTCKVVAYPARVEFARLTVLRNGRRLGLALADLQFTWEADGRLSHRVDTTYLPEEDTALDWFQCQAEDPLRFQAASQSLRVSYKAGLRRLHLFSPATGQLLTGDSGVTDADSVGCQADVAMPAVTYAWQVMRNGRLTNMAGQNVSLKGVNLFYPVCCSGQNELDGKKFKAKACANFRGNSTFNSVKLFNKDGRREVALVCGRRSTMGIVQVRYSELSCNVKEFEALGSNGSGDGQNASSSSSSSSSSSEAEDDCPTQKCASDTALSQVRRNCKKREDGCYLDATWLMDPFMKEALKARDTLPTECFTWDQGLIKIEVDYFCTSPNFVQFDATDVGRRGRVQKYHVPRSGCYEIVARGASGGNHSTSYGPAGSGRWTGGSGAEQRGRFQLNRGVTLSILVGQHGGNSSEISPTHRPSIEDNAGTGGGGGSFVFSGGSGRMLYLAAGGGGGASYGLAGVPGQAGPNGTDSSGPNDGHRGRGGAMGSAGWTNTDAASYHGGCGAGWLSGGARRAGPEHGGPGHDPNSPDGPFLGGAPGGMNPGAVGGFGGGGGGSEDNGASGGGGGFSGGGAGTHDKQAGGGGGSYCNVTLAAEDTCGGVTGGNRRLDGGVTVYYLGSTC